MGVLKKECSSIAGDLTQPGIRFVVDGSTWNVRPERLSVESTDPDLDCGKLIAKVLSKLRWTPVMAIGSNFTFTTNAARDSGIPVDFKLPSSKKHKFSSRVSQVTVPHDDREVVIQLTAEETGFTLLLNNHTDIQAKRLDGKQLVRSRRARSACELFFEHREQSVQLAKSILGGQFIYVNDDIV